MPTRTHIIAIVLMIAIPLAIFLFDSRWSAETYRCDGAKVFTLHPNFPDHATFGEVRLEGSIVQGSATAANFPDEQAPALPLDTPPEHRFRNPILASYTIQSKSRSTPRPALIANFTLPIG